MEVEAPLGKEEKSSHPVPIPSSSPRREDLDAVPEPPADRIRGVSAPYFTNYGKGGLATQMHLLKKGII